jgi:5-hydroxyisourate hydrolase
VSSVSTHILDTALGAPAAGVRATLESQHSDTWKQVGEGRSDANGRIAAFVPKDVSLACGVYRLRFDTAAYQRGFFPEVVVVFLIENEAQHYHVPLLLSPFGYSTYRGS